MKQVNTKLELSLRMMIAVALMGSSFCSMSSRASDFAVPSRVLMPVNDTDRVTLTGGTHPLAAAALDQGAAAGDTQMGHLYLALQRSAEQERSLEAMHARQYDETSPDYHHWLQPAEFGLAYGPNDADISAATSWLKSNGLQVLNVANGRVFIEFTGTAAQVQRAFGVQIHRYTINGATQLANDRNPQIPQALSPVIMGVVGLDNIPMQTDVQVRGGQSGTLQKSSQAEVVNPDLTVTGNVVTPYFVTPYDFATIYNSLPLWKASTPIKGAGITVAIAGGYDVNPADVTTFRSSFGLADSSSTYALTIKQVGTDPKKTSLQDTVEVEMVTAAAPDAKVVLVVPNGGGVAFANFYDAAGDIVDTNLAPILVGNLSECESILGSNTTKINGLWEQAALQSISVFVSAGGRGSAGCSTGAVDTNGLQVNGIASSPYVTAVGGTDFTWAWQPFKATTYWNTTGTDGGNTPQLSSAKGYIPEMPWNVSCANGLLTTQYFANVGHKYKTPEENCNAYYNNSLYYPILTPAGGGGGISTVYSQPSWQLGTTGAPSSKRAIPDVSIFASGGFPIVPDTGSLAPTSLIQGSSIAICYSGGGHACNFVSKTQLTYDDIAWQTVGGTGAASAYWAGILALVEQKHGGTRQGLINSTLYKLFAKENLSGCNSVTVSAGNDCVFYDIASFPDYTLTPALSNAQPCKYGSTTACVGTGLLYGILNGYSEGKGYDEATGLGSVNIANLVNAWPSAAPTATVSLSASSLSFGSTAAGATSATQSVVIKNTSKLAVTFTSGGIALSGQSDDFEMKNGCGSSLVVGGSCTITLSFKPVSAGTKSATLHIADNAAGSPQPVSLSGTGT